MSYATAIIPARSGSKGVSGKNLKLLAGRPLMAYSIAAAFKTEKIDRVIVSTDSTEYASVARNYGAEVPFIRPPEISLDNSTDYEFIRHALDWMLANEGNIPPLLVLLRPTTPLRQVVNISSAIELIRKDNGATSLRSVHEMSESAYKGVFEIEEQYLKSFATGTSDMDSVNLPRQGYPKTYAANGYVDVIRSGFVIERQRIFGDRTIAFETPRIMEVDTVEDFNYLEYQVSENRGIVDALFG